MHKTAVYVGRFNPIHRGHTAIISHMIETFGVENCLFIIGSSNAPLSLRHFFSYDERRTFIKKIFPEIRLAGLPDFPEDRDWLAALDDIIKLGGIDPQNTTYFGGCDEDIRFFKDDGRGCAIINRFDGSTAKISATEIRDALIHDRPIKEWVHEGVHDDVVKGFKEKWERFKQI